MRNVSDPFENVSPEGAGELSSAGSERKAEVLRLLKTACVRRGRRRLVAKGVAVAVILVGCGVLAFVGLNDDGARSDQPLQVAERAPFPGGGVALKHVHFGVIRNREGLVDRYIVPSSSVDLGQVVIQDTELLTLMAAAERPAGLVRIGGRAYLSTELAGVFDEAETPEGNR
jgi:hypothetical protein